MAHRDRTYMIVEAPNGGAPQHNPVLGDQSGQVWPANQLLIFNKSLENPPLKKVDHYRIRFEIYDFNSSLLRFTPNEADMMWVQKGTGSGSCPTSQCYMPDSIWVDDYHPQGKWIDVINMDMRVEEFWFTLNLVDKSNPTSTSYVPVDPGGGNQNGGMAGSALTLNSMLVAGGTTGAIVGIGATAVANNAFVPMDALIYGVGGAVAGLVVAFVVGRSNL